MAIGDIVYAVDCESSVEGLIWFFTVHQRDETKGPGELIGQRHVGTGVLAKEVVKKIVAEGNNEEYTEICEACGVVNHTNPRCPDCREMINDRSTGLKLLSLQETDKELAQIRKTVDKALAPGSSANNGPTK